MDNNIIEKAQELGKLIADSELYLKLKSAEEIQLNDPVAQQMMNEYNNKREELAKKASEPNLTKEDYEKLQMDAQAEFIKLCQNEKIKNYLDANQKFSELINRVNSIITYYVRGEEEGGCTGNCSQCGGCH